MQELLKRISVSSIVFFTVLIAGCVTTIEGGKQEVNKEKALDTYVQLGLNYLRAGNRDSARLHFNNALEINDNSPGANDGMALLYQLEAEKELAEKHFKKAIRSDRNFSRARNNYGSFLFQEERYEEAFDQFETAAKDLSYPSRPIALVNLGRTAQKLEKPDRAQAAFEHALSLDPKQSAAMVELAEIAFNKGEYADAKRYIDQYAEITRHSPRTLWLGIRLEKIFGNRDKEASYGLQLRSLHPYSQEYLDYKQSLESQQ